MIAYGRVPFVRHLTCSIQRLAVEALRVVRRMLLLVVVVVPWVTKPVAQPHQE
eukprot:COSAG01_NODE_24171_length_787_cov_699.510174_2_plen_52_part_01